MERERLAESRLYKRQFRERKRLATIAIRVKPKNYVGESEKAPPITVKLQLGPVAWTRG